MADAQPYVAAWLAREPGMELARVFCAPAQRELFDLWGALLDQLDEAAFELSDANVARTKLAWWGEELASIATGGGRHPLAKALARHESVRAVAAPDWHALAHAAMLAGASEHAPADIDALFAPGAPYARVTARIEAQVFGAKDVSTPESVAVHQLLRRLEHSLGRDAASFPWPLNLRARHQAAPQDFSAWKASPAARAVLADLIDAMLARGTRARGATRFRRLQAALDARRLRHLMRGGDQAMRAAGPATLWSLWRAARGA